MGATSPYTVAVQEKGVTTATLKSPFRDDRVYCYSLLSRDRA